MSHRERIPPVDDFLKADHFYTFGSRPTIRLARLSAFVGKHTKNPELYLEVVDELLLNLEDLPSAMREMTQARKRGLSTGFGGRAPTDGTPRVAFFIDHTSKGNLRVSYFPEFPRDFAQTEDEYVHHRGYDPVNSLLFIHDFDRLWEYRSGKNPPWMDRHEKSELHLRLMCELLDITVDIVKSAEEELGKHYELLSTSRFARTPSGELELLSGEEVERRETAAKTAKEEIENERREAPLRSELDQWANEFGMQPSRIITLVSSFSPLRVPMSGRIEVMVQRFGMKRPSSVATFDGTVRRMRNVLEQLDIKIEDEPLAIETARELARDCLGKIRGVPRT